MKQKKIIVTIVANKYLLTLLIFITWMVFLDNHNFLFMNKNQRKLNKLKVEKEYFEKKIEADKQKIKELQTSSENLEKFAREQFMMKRDNEDIFVIIEQ